MKLALYTYALSAIVSFQRIHGLESAATINVPDKDDETEKHQVDEHPESTDAHDVNVHDAEEDVPSAGNKRVWGTPSVKDTADQPKMDASVLMNASSENRTRPSIPLKGPPKTKAPETSAPVGFRIAARVYIDPNDRQSHFTVEDEHIPYWDCGISGATTSPLLVRDAVFRQTLASSPTSWKDANMHPALAVLLSDAMIELNSGETMFFEAGKAVLLEDVILPGHEIRSNSSAMDLNIMFLALPKQHLHVGREKRSMKYKKTNHPCPTDVATEQSQVHPTASALVETPQRVRTLVLSAIGLSLSTLLVDFLGRTAPLWLAVGVGGTCFVAGGTIGFIIAGHNILSMFELWWEHRRLGDGRQGGRSNMMLT